MKSNLIIPELFPHPEPGFAGCCKAEAEEAAAIEKPRRKKKKPSLLYAYPTAGVFKPNCACRKCKCNKKN